MRRPTLKAKVSEKGNILGALFALGKLSKDHEPLEALAASEAERLPSNGQTVEVAFRNVAPLHDAGSTNSLVNQVDNGENNAHGEDPLRDVDGDGWIDLRCPSVKGEQVDGRENVDGVEGDRKDHEKHEVAIGEWGAAAAGLEVVETDVLPFRLGQILRLLLAVTETTHRGAMNWSELIKRKGLRKSASWRRRLEPKKKKRKTVVGYRKEV
jgi:hypothetical protein